MKRSGKFLAAIILFAVLVSALVIAVSANGGTDAPFLIDGEEYGVSGTTTFADALAEVKTRGASTLKLNTDVTLTGKVTIDSDLVLDLGGKTVSASAVAFEVASGVTFELWGEGTMEIASNAIVTKSGASVKLTGKGSGLDFKPTAAKITIFNLEGGYKEMTVTGAINILPCDNETTIFSAAKNSAGTTEATASVLTLKNARLTAQYPTNEAAKYAGDAVQATRFATLNDGNKLVIEDSKVILNHGQGIYCTGTAGTVDAVFNDDCSINSLADGASEVAVRHWIYMTDSTFAVHSGFSKSYNYYGAGAVLSFGTTAAQAYITDCDLYGAARAFCTSDSRLKQVVVPSNIYLKNTNYTADGADNIIYTAPWMIEGRTNIIWDGGIIDNAYATFSAAKSITFTPGAEGAPSGELSREEIYGANAKALATAAGFTIADTDYVTITQNKDGTATYKYYKKTYHDDYQAVAYGGCKYSEVGDDWYGILLKNLYFIDKYPVASVDAKPGAADNTNGAACNYSYEGTASDTDSYILSGYPEYKTVKYTYSFSDYIRVKYTDADVISGQTTGWSGETTTIASNRYGKHAWIGTDKSNDSGNGYLKFYIDKDTYNVTTNPYIAPYYGGYGAYIKPTYEADGSIKTPAYIRDSNYPIQGYKYVVQEIDLATESGNYSPFAVHFYARYYSASFMESNGELVVKSINTTPTQVQKSSQFFAVDANGNISLTNTSEKTNKALKLSKEPFDWARLTLVYEISYTETSYKPLSGSELTRPAYDFSGTKAHLYLDGEWIASYRGFIGTLIDKEFINSFGFDQLRFSFTANTYKADASSGTGYSGYDSDMLFDNIRVDYYKASDDIAAICANPKKALEKNTHTLIMPETAYLNNPVVGEVDGVEYRTEELLLGAIKDGSFVSLSKNLESALPGDKTYTVMQNGYSIPDVVSATHKVLHYGDITEVAPARDFEIYNIIFDDISMTGASDSSVNAALGTLIPVPNSVKPENVKGKYVESEGYVYNIAAWTLDASLDTETLIADAVYAKDGAINAYAIHRFGSPATVIWKDADGNTVATDYYAPGEGAYATPNDGKLVPASETFEHGWYAIGFVGWNENVDEVELTEAKEYVFTPKMGVVLSPDGVSNIKINVSVYTDFELNIFIPETKPAEVGNVVLSRTPDGNTPVRPEKAASNLTAFNPTSVTIGGVPYTKYIDNFATADTTLETYYLVYTVNDKQLVQTIQYGIPYYASALMADKNASFEAKALVMNIANYADKLIKLLEQENDDGARIYSGLLSKYGSDSGLGYLSGYDMLYDERFAANDNPATDTISNDIYDGISSLTFKNAAGYIDGASILFTESAPVFVFKYGAKSISNEAGIKAPTGNDGYYSHNSVGIFTYFQYSGDVSAYPAAHYAYDGDIYTGTRYGKDDAVWLENTVALTDASGTRYYYDLADARYEDADGNAYTGKESDLVYADDVSYYAIAYPYRYRNQDRGWQRVYDLLSPVKLDVRSYNESTKKVTYLTNVTYSLTAYIKSMIDAGETEYAELGKALYAYALTASNYKNKVEIPALGEPVAENTAETLSDGTELIAAENTVYSDKALRFYCELDSLGAGDEIYVGHAKLPTLDANGNYDGGAYASTYLIITRSTVQLVNYYNKTNHNIAVTPGTPNAKPVIYNHGLFISDFIEVYIEADNGTNSLVLKTATGSYKNSNISWAGRQGKVLAKPVGTSLSNVSLEWHCDALSEDLWFFGDSYFNYGDKTRWPYYMKQDGYDHNSCLFGYPGMNSTPAIRDFKWAVEELGYRPKVVVWAEGMNDGDGTNATAPNATWLANTQEFLSICEEVGITPVLCTIPSTPTVYNGAKNAWIKASGYRYVDTAAAVGEAYDESLIGTVPEGSTKTNVTGYTWTEGYLSTDLVHPAAPGARALYDAFLAAVPEIKGDYSNTNN